MDNLTPNYRRYKILIEVMVMKKFISGMIFGAVIMLAAGTFAVEELVVSKNTIPIVKNGVEVPAEGYNINGYTFLKARDIANLLDAPIEYKDNKIYVGGDVTNQKSGLYDIPTTPEQSDKTSKVTSTNMPPQNIKTAQSIEIPEKYKKYDTITVDGKIYIEPLSFKTNNINKYNVKFDVKTNIWTIISNSDKSIIKEIDLNNPNNAIFKNSKYYINIKVIDEIAQ